MIMLTFEEGSSRHWILNTKERRMKLKINIIIRSEFRDKQQIFFFNLRNMKNIFQEKVSMRRRKRRRTKMINGQTLTITNMNLFLTSVLFLL